MKNNQQKQIKFRIAKTLRMDHQAGTYRSGKPWVKWSQLFRGDDGVLYSCFQPRPVYAAANSAVTGTFAGVSPFRYDGEKVIQVKNARAATAAEPEETTEQEATDYGLNLEAARAENPFWWVDEVRPRCSPVTEENLVLSYSPAQQAALAEYFGMDEPFSHPNEKA